MARSISARCINSSTVRAAATSPPQPGLPPPVRRNRRITPRMDSTSAEPTASSPPRSSSKQSTLNSINTNPINGANLIGTNNTEYGIVTDNTAIMVAAKYTWDPFKFFVGYEHIQQFNPSNPLGIGASAQGGYLLSGVEDNNLDSPKLV